MCPPLLPRYSSFFDDEKPKLTINPLTLKAMAIFRSMFFFSDCVANIVGYRISVYLESAVIDVVYVAILIGVVDDARMIFNNLSAHASSPAIW